MPLTVHTVHRGDLRCGFSSVCASCRADQRKTGQAAEDGSRASSEAADCAGGNSAGVRPVRTGLPLPVHWCSGMAGVCKPPWHCSNSEAFLAYEWPGQSAWLQRPRMGGTWRCFRIRPAGSAQALTCSLARRRGDGGGRGSPRADTLPLAARAAALALQRAHSVAEVQAAAAKIEEVMQVRLPRVPSSSVTSSLCDSSGVRNT